MHEFVCKITFSEISAMNFNVIAFILSLNKRKHKHDILEIYVDPE